MSPTDHETPADRKRDAERIQSEYERRLQAAAAQDQIEALRDLLADAHRREQLAVTIGWAGVAGLYLGCGYYAIKRVFRGLGI